MYNNVLLKYYRNVNNAASDKPQAPSAKLASSKAESGKVASGRQATACGKAARPASGKTIYSKTASVKREPASGVSSCSSVNKRYFCESLRLIFKMAVLRVKLAKLVTEF